MSPAPLLETTGLAKHFPLTRSVGEIFGRRPGRAIHAVDGVSLTIAPGETLGLIGESGSGKTTFGWVVSRIHDPTAGTIRFEGSDVTELSGERLRAWRRNVQVVFQDPVGSLDPRLKVWQIVSEPYRAQAQTERAFLRRERRRVRKENRRRERRNRKAAKQTPPLPEEPMEPLPRLPPRLARSAIRQRVREVLETVGLPIDCLDQYPHEFSGGGRQRISLARALSVDPKLIVLDEPTSALDVAVQAQILIRLVELQRERHGSYLMITHNVAAVRYIADRVAVMYLGQLLEVGPTREVLERPVHPYTKALLAAVPVPDVRRRRTRYRIGGDIPTLIDPVPGCRFAPRCPFVQDRCREADPPLGPVPGAPGHQVACRRAEEVAAIPPEALLTTAEPGTSGPGPNASTAVSVVS